MTYKLKAVAFWLVLVIVAIMLWTAVRNRPANARATYTQFLRQVQSGEVSRATIITSQGGADRVDYQLKNGSPATAIVPSRDRSLLEILQQKMVEIEIRDASTQWLRVLANSSPFLLLLVAWFIAMGFLRRKPAA
ncbi:MAG TPA: ATP-dependent metallopeptidase FtsH/Yme1/Tma family protein [Bryobacteraceae bacterium]|nr:ATP-dependent metallopeptidase FtsH/Yme1/Tma family protein [Bryobacteraceae bacterium]